MVFENIARGHQQTRDSVGSNPNVIPIPKILSEKQKTWQEPLVIHDRDIDNSWIVGSSTNAIVGTHTGTSGGGQLVVGGTSNTETLLRIVAPRAQWANFLRDTPTNKNQSTNTEGLVVDSLTTGTIDTSNNRIDLDSGEDIVWRIAYNDGTWNSITPVFDLDSGRTNFDFDAYSDVAGDTFTFTFPIEFGGASAGIEVDVSSDGGSTWEEADNKVTHTFDSPGSDIRIRLRSGEDGRFWKTTDANGREKPILMRLG